MKHRICCAESIVERLNARVFHRRAVSDALKGKFVDSAVFTSLLYGLEHCASGIRDQRCLDGYFLRLAKRIMHLPYDHHLSYQEAEERLGVTRPSIRLSRERMRWLGHALRSQDVVLREVLLFIPDGGSRGRGRPRRRLYDTIKADLKARQIDIDTRDQHHFWSMLTSMAEDRNRWNLLVNT